MRFPATRSDFARTLHVLAQLERGCGSDDTAAFARRLFDALDGLVAPAFSTLGVCRVDTLRSRTAVGRLPPEQPVHCAGCRHYGHALGCLRGMLVPSAPAIGSAHRIVVPVQVRGHRCVSLVLTRSGAGFSDRDRARVELLRPHLAFFYRQACGVVRASPGTRLQEPLADTVPCAAEGEAGRLTQREAQVLQWLAFGKTDAEIGALLAVSPRTVSKHLEHIYVKLGVETRTAAVMRALHLDPARLRMH